MFCAQSCQHPSTSLMNYELTVSHGGAEEPRNESLKGQKICNQSCDLCIEVHTLRGKPGCMQLKGPDPKAEQLQRAIARRTET